MVFRFLAFSFVMLTLTVRVPAQERQTVCFFGDSITEGWIDGERRPAEAYPSLVDSMLRSADLDVRLVVAARGGETTEDALSRFENDVRNEHPHVVVFAFGSNDSYVWGKSPAPRVSLARFRYNCRVMFEALSRSKIRVVVLPPPPVLESRFYRYTDSLLYVPYGGAARLRDRYAETLADLASDFPCANILDLATLLLAGDTALGFDGLHPSAIGHRIIARAVSIAVRTALEQPCSEEVALEGIRMYPLPYNRQVYSVSSISFPVIRAGTHVLRIFDTTGRLVRTFEYAVNTTGAFSVLWNGSDENGTNVAPGAYILTVSAPQGSTRPFPIIVL
ncbi:MAG: hypothetical protein KFF77_10145 [Bacteroidetes bacterium]|nr:hypothetical protein [Bacteroidota bacterium]